MQRLFIPLLLLLPVSGTWAQTSAGPQNPSASSAVSCAFSFGSPLQISPGANTYSSDNVYASATHCACCDANTTCLQVSGFGFSIPAGSQITGIEVHIEKRGSTGSDIRDNEVMLVKNGLETGANLAQNSTAWPYTDTYVNYGGPGNLWGTTWTAADLNASNFGVNIACIDYSCGSADAVSYIDHISVTVWYDSCSTVTASFSANTITPYTAAFSNTSTGASTWSWNFGDSQTSTQLNPSHTYAAAGVYSVCLIAASNCSADTLCQNIEVCAPLQTTFSHTVTGGTAQFTDMSQQADSWNWDFGDGNTAAVQNPSHTYATPGTYTVCLIAGNACTTDTVCQDIVIPDGTSGLPSMATHYLSISPNPAQDMIRISLPENLQHLPAELWVRDILGRTMLLPATHTSGQMIQADISALTPGLYLVMLRVPGQGDLQGVFLKK